MGDSIMAHAAMQQVLRNRPEWTTSYQQAANLEVSLIMRPQLHCRSLLDLPACNMAPLIHFGINTILFDDKRRMHPINHFLELCGMAQDETPQPEYSPVYMWQPHQGEFAPERPIPSYDFIIAPFSNATRMDEPRMLEFSHYPYLFAQLGRMYTGPAARCRIAVIGGHDSPMPWGNPLRESKHWAFDHSEVYYEYGRPLSEVLGMMRACRGAIITVDSGANRLAHLAGVDNHIILSPDFYPAEWVGHPGAYQIRGNPDTWTNSKILNTVEEVIHR